MPSRSSPRHPVHRDRESERADSLSHSPPRYNVIQQRWTEKAALGKEEKGVTVEPEPRPGRQRGSQRNPIRSGPPLHVCKTWREEGVHVCLRAKPP